MSALKTGLTVALAALFSIACTSAPETTNQNRNAASPSPGATAQTANANTSEPGAAATTPAAATANANQSSPASPANPAAGYGNRNAGVKTATNVDAASLYVAQKCAGCHGPDGKGKVKDVPDFTDAAWQKKESDIELISQIKKGAPPKMPSYKDKLNDAEIKALVAYIRAFAK
jgi:mono/diheme cytochrome c family protein